MNFNKTTTQTLAEHLGRYISYPHAHGRTLHTMWILHSWLTHRGAFDVSPRLAFLSAEPGSGKTVALEFTKGLTPNSLIAVNMTPSSLFRTIGKSPHTILMDEVDNIFTGKDEDNKSLLAMLNNGYRKGGEVIRVESNGKDFEPKRFEVFAPVAFAGLDNLPTTLADRTLAVEMRRALPSERPDRYRQRTIEVTWEKMRLELAQWTEKRVHLVNDDLLDEAYTALPTYYDSRYCELSEVMVATAILTGEEWTDRTLEALEYAYKESRQNNKTQLSTQLLADIRSIFRETGSKDITLAELTAELHRLEESPWLENGNNGNAISKHKVSSLLKNYKIKTKQKRVGGEHKRVYEAEMFKDAFSRYLPPENEPN